MLRGVQVDPNKERREAVKRKITQYLRRAEEIFNCHLQRSLGSGSPADTGYSSLRFRPIRTLSSAVENLRRCKVVGVIDKVQIVQDPDTGGTFILKSLPKSYVEARERQTIIPHGVPFMVKLLCYYVSEDSIFLHLEHVQGEMLWSHLRSKYCVQQGSSDGSGSLPSKHIPSLRDCGREETEESSCGSNRDCLCSAQTGRGPLGSAKRRLLGKPDPSAPREEPPASVRRPALPGVMDRVPAASTKASSHPSDQGLAPCPCDSLTSSEGEDTVSQRAASQQDPRLFAGQGLPRMPKTGIGGCPGKEEAPFCQVSEAPWAQSLVAAPGGKQLCAGIARRSSGRPDAAVQEPACRASMAGGPHGEEPVSAQCRSLAPCGHTQRAWAVKEEQVQLWAAEILLALEGLHQQGVLCRDLNPRNVLLDTAGHVRLTFFGQWAEVEPRCSSRALEELYGAPEVGGVSELTEAADCWSFGSLLYELLTGVPLSQNHPSGIQPHTQLYLPEGLSLAAVSLLTELLQHSPRRRLGSGGGGIAKLKSHSF
ncbi:PREDICTED: ribosomal protein S6 kinase-like 1, partial [Tinamus guttatus]|uniref:ribosomal protein S6 kinase-like 1 n=1 Tax=Tinamus guttatus TaxID=94827 RepID=UPI00052ECFA8